MIKTIFSIPKMDCPSEEKIIRMALGKIEGIEILQFDLANRKLTAFHKEDPRALLEKLVPLHFGAVISESAEVAAAEQGLLQVKKEKYEVQEKEERKVLKILLAINGCMFVGEVILGLYAQSTGLIADAMDMFADAAVYGISLYAVGKAVQMQRAAARFSGYAQALLAFFVLLEVVRCAFFGSNPEPAYMIFVSLVALVANVICFILIMKHRSGGAHLKASAIFSANDVIANCGVISAGVLVNLTGSRIPDLVVGLLITTIVFCGAIIILRISSEDTP